MESWGGLGYFARWKYEYDGRERLVAATQEQGPLKVRVEYAYDPFDRLVGRAVSKGTTTDPNAVWTHYLYADGQPYADATTGGTITQRYLFSTDGAPLARLMDGAASPDFYLSDRQNSVLQIADAAGTTLKRVRYEGLKAVERVGAAASDRFELGGQTHDREVGLSMLGGSWYHPDLGRNLTENGRGIGLNPYPVAENNAPNEVKPEPSQLKKLAKFFFENTNDIGDQPASDGARFARGVGRTLFDFPMVIYDGFIETPRWMLFGDDLSNPEYSSFYYKGMFEAAGDKDTRRQWWRETSQNLLLPVRPLGQGIERGATTGDWGEASEAAGSLTGSVIIAFAGGRASGAFRGQSTVAVGRGMYARPTATGLGASLRWYGAAATRAVGASLLDAVTPMGSGFLVGRMLKAWSPRTAVQIKRSGHDHSSWKQPLTAAFADWAGIKTCFVAGTPIQWQYGAKAIELFRSYEEYGDDCDWIVSRNEHNEDGILTLRRVLRKFVRTGLVLNLKLPGGIIIGTTGEHPFWLKGRGWTPAQELKPGDQIRLMEPGWVTVVGVEDTGLVETVYNLEIEDDHTYFVGCDEWGFSVWAHNRYENVTEEQVAAAFKAAGVPKDVAELVAQRGAASAIVADQLLTLAQNPAITSLMTSGAITPLSRPGVRGFSRKLETPTNGEWIPLSEHHAATPGNALFRSSDAQFARLFGDILFRDGIPIGFDQHAILTLPVRRLTGKTGAYDQNLGAYTLAEWIAAAPEPRMAFLRQHGIDTSGLTTQSGKVKWTKVLEAVRDAEFTFDHHHDLMSLRLQPRALNELSHTGGRAMIGDIMEQLNSVGVNPKLRSTPSRTQGLTPELLDFARYVGIVPVNTPFGR